MAMNDKKLATTANQSLAHAEPYVAETVILLDPRTESVPTKPWWDGQLTVARRSEWTDGCSRVLLFWVGFALIIGLAILFR